MSGARAVGGAEERAREIVAEGYDLPSLTAAIAAALLEVEKERDEWKERDARDLRKCNEARDRCGVLKAQRDEARQEAAAVREQWNSNADVLTRQRDAHRERADRADRLIRDLVSWFGPWHDDDCPGDDTCDCSAKPLHDRIDAHLAAEPEAEPDAATVPPNSDKLPGQPGGEDNGPCPRCGRLDCGEFGGCPPAPAAGGATFRPYPPVEIRVVTAWRDPDPQLQAAQPDTWLATLAGSHLIAQGIGFGETVAELGRLILMDREIRRNPPQADEAPDGDAAEIVLALDERDRARAALATARGLLRRWSADGDDHFVDVDTRAFLASQEGA